ncbi:hypothetical protein [[Mycoplasma] testudinis]|uniref:hypothetical protein n=1 Tax=[Mycoplasma] testudinis TaxID=33924 RepID=UPI0004873274|nr:hypothetical protein [[Mycoplasma] testudinis]
MEHFDIYSLKEFLHEDSRDKKLIYLSSFFWTYFILTMVYDLAIIIASIILISVHSSSGVYGVPYGFLIPIFIGILSIILIIIMPYFMLLVLPRLYGRDIIKKMNVTNPKWNQKWYSKKLGRYSFYLRALCIHYLKQNNLKNISTATLLFEVYQNKEFLLGEINFITHYEKITGKQAKFYDGWPLFINPLPMA